MQTNDLYIYYVVNAAQSWVLENLTSCMESLGCDDLRLTQANSSAYGASRKFPTRKKVLTLASTGPASRCWGTLRTMPETPSVVLTIAGFDPSSGAGITADIKTIAAHGCYGVACITAMTVQSTAGLKRVEPCAPELVADTLQELAADVKIAAVHIGMLGSGKVARAVADFLSGKKAANVVLDPILRASSGADLLDASGWKVLAEHLLPL